MRVLRPPTLYTPSRTNWRTHYHITDVHLGHIACDEPMLRRDIQRIADDPLATWGGGGDIIDAINHIDPRFKMANLAEWVKKDTIQSQINRAVSYLKPIMDKCLYFLTGNHEEKVYDKTGHDVYALLLDKLTDSDLDWQRRIALRWEGFIKLTFRRGTPDQRFNGSVLWLYVHHGAGAGRKKGAPALRAEDIMGRYQADLYLVGHRHIRDTYSMDVWRPGTREAVAHKRLWIYGGSYMRADFKDDGDIPTPHYPESKQLIGQTAGIVPIRIKPDCIPPLVIPLVGNGDIGPLLDSLREND